jgi:hypothetical protein
MNMKTTPLSMVMMTQQIILTIVMVFAIVFEWIRSNLHQIIDQSMRSFDKIVKRFHQYVMIVWRVQYWRLLIIFSWVGQPYPDWHLLLWYLLIKLVRLVIVYGAVISRMNMICFVVNRLGFHSLFLLNIKLTAFVAVTSFDGSTS